MGVLCVIAAFVLSGCNRNADRHDAVDYAVRFARCMEKDELSIQHQSQALEGVVQVLLARGAPDRALTAANAMGDWRRGTAFADIATVYAQTGQTVRARALLRECDALRARIVEEQFLGTMGWTAQRIEQHMTVARMALGERNVVIDTNAHHDLSPRVIEATMRISAPTGGAPARPSLAAALTDNPDPALQDGLAAGLLAVAESAERISSNELDRIVADVNAQKRLQPVAWRVPLVLRLSALLRRHDRTAQAEALIGEAEAAARGQPHGFNRATLLAAIGVTRQVAGQPAGRLLVDEAVKELGASCEAPDRVQAKCRISVLCRRGGWPVRANALLLSALADTDAMDNPATRLSRRIGVCAALIGADDPIPVELRSALDNRMAGENSRLAAVRKIDKIAVAGQGR